MIEETTDQVEHSDDVSVLRVLLHDIKGISPVSGNIYELAPEYAPSDDDEPVIE